MAVGVDSPDRCYFYDAYSNLRSASLGQTTGCSKEEGSVIYSSDALDRMTQQTVVDDPDMGRT